MGKREGGGFRTMDIKILKLPFFFPPIYLKKLLTFNLPCYLPDFSSFFVFLTKFNPPVISKCPKLQSKIVSTNL